MRERSRSNVGARDRHYKWAESVSVMLMWTTLWIYNYIRIRLFHFTKSECLLDGHRRVMRGCVKSSGMEWRPREQRTQREFREKKKIRKKKKRSIQNRELVACSFGAVEGVRSMFTTFYSFLFFFIFSLCRVSFCFIISVLCNSFGLLDCFLWFHKNIKVSVSPAPSHSVGVGPRAWLVSSHHRAQHGL